MYLLVLSIEQKDKKSYLKITLNYRSILTDHITRQTEESEMPHKTACHNPSIKKSFMTNVKYLGMVRDQTMFVLLTAVRTLD